MRPFAAILLLVLGLGACDYQPRPASAAKTPPTAAVPQQGSCQVTLAIDGMT